MTLEEAYHSTADGEPHLDYDNLRAAKVAEISEDIADDLKPGISANHIAELLMTKAEETGHIFGNTIEGEIPSRYTIHGNPIPFIL